MYMVYARLLAVGRLLVGWNRLLAVFITCLPSSISVLVTKSYFPPGISTPFPALVYMLVSPCHRNASVGACFGPT